MEIQDKKLGFVNDKTYNWYICTKKRYLMLYIPRDAFLLPRSSAVSKALQEEETIGQEISSHVPSIWSSDILAHKTITSWSSRDFHLQQNVQNNSYQNTIYVGILARTQATVSSLLKLRITNNLFCIIYNEIQYRIMNT